MKLPTGSAVERTMACAASCVLNRAGHTGEAAVAGTDNHEEISEGDRTRPVVDQMVASADDVRHEVAYALNVRTRTVREIGVNLGRNYGELDDAEIAMTVDLECRKDGVWWVGDWKSRGRVTSVADNWQIRCGVIAVMARHSADAAIGFIGYLDDSELEAEKFDAFHVTSWWDDLRAMVKRIRAAADVAESGGMPEVNAGAWCQYCPSLPYCPAHTRLALSLLGELDRVDAAIGALTVEQCGRAWELLKRYEIIAERVKQTIQVRASRELVPLSNGRKLAPVECKGRMNLDQKKAKELLAELGQTIPMKRGKPYVQVREAKVVEEEVSDV